MRGGFFSLLTIFLLAACGQAPVKPAEEQAVAVEVVPVSGARATSVIAGTGSFRHEREIVLSFRDPGTVREVKVESGDFVRKGQVIARQDFAQLDMRASNAAAQYQKSIRDLDRDKKLAAQGWISGQRLADRQTAVTSAKAALDSANFDRRISTLAAPSDGLVLVRHVRAGEVVGSGMAVITLTDIRSPMVVRAALADADVARVRLGDPAWVTVSALPGTRLAGTVSRIDQRVDIRTGATDVDIQVPSTAGLKTGFVASFGITARAAALTNGTGTQGTAIPAEAIVEASGTTATVYVVDGTGKHAKRMRVGFLGFDGDFARVTGLAAGQKVVTSGGALVKDGSLLLVVAGGA
jgi:RND family efflux transporter MFP subunit